MESTFFRDAAEVVGLLIGIGTVLTALWRYVIRPLWRWGKSVGEVNTKVQRIWMELQPNGGSTFRDQLNRLNDVASRIETRQIVSEQIDKQVFAALSIGVFRTDADGRCTEVNLNYCRLTGRTSEELLGPNWANFLHPEDRARVWTEWHECVQETRMFESTYRYVRPDGMSQKVQGRACALLNRDGKAVGWFGTIEKLGDAESV